MCLVYNHDNCGSNASIMRVILNLFVVVPEDCLSLQWPNLDLSGVEPENFISEEPGILVMNKHAGIRDGDGYLCFTTYAIVYACRLNYGPYVKLSPAFAFPPLEIGMAHKVGVMSERQGFKKILRCHCFMVFSQS